MSQKRQQQGEGGPFYEKRSRKSPSFRSVVLDVMNLQRLQNLMYPVLEPLVRRVVKEEVDSALGKYIISMKRNKEVHHRTESRGLQLLFLNAISLPVFTGTRIEGEDGSNLEVALIDVLSGEVVSTGLGSSAKVEIVVLEGDFDGNEGENWTSGEFSNNIVREREGKKPLLSGDVVLTLKNGTGFVGDVAFTDNSSWTRSRKFRMGARVIDDIGGARIREARSEPFIVRDHRGELYKKHHPPSPRDEVWRLEKIGKDGAFHKRLNKERVFTVLDFLILLSLSPTRLRNILGPGMSAKKWEITVKHAQTCVLEKTLYFYNTSTSLEKNGVAFNVVGEVMGMFSNDHYVTADKLSDAEKAAARELVISAFQDREKITTLDESFLNMPTSSPNLSYSQDPSNMIVDVSPDFMQTVHSGGGSSSYDYYLHGVDTMDMGYDHPLTFPNQPSADLIPDMGNDQLRYFETDCSLESSNLDFSADLHSAINARFPPIEKPQKGWATLVCVLRWRFSIKRIMARKSSKTRVRAIP